MVLAFSLQSDIKSIGAYAGFAAIIGLALLVLLYFAQAREVRRMSDWLEQQEDRLRNLPARSPMPRPVPTPPGARAVPTPQALPAQALPAQAAPPEEGVVVPAATVAVPGARRVAVGAGGAVVAGDPAPAAGSGDPPGAVVAGAVAAATVAGAMAAASAGSAPSASEGVDDTADTVAPNRVLAPAAAKGAEEASAATSPRGGAPAAQAQEGAQPPATGGSASPSAAVPLTARAAATAEPVGPAQALGAEAAGSGASPDTTESAIVGPLEPDSGTVAMLEPGAGGVARFAPPSGAPFGPQDDVVAPFASDAAVEISAERVVPSAVEVSSPLALPLDGDVQDEPAAAVDDDDEPPALAPSTPAGARTRFPPAPDARATPVGVTARAGSGAVGPVEAALGAGAPAGTTQRRERDRPPPDDGDDDGRHGSASVLRLLAAAIVIVVVLIFIATKVFAPSKTTGLAPSKVIVAVLNGTRVAGLAGQAAVKLSAGGFERGGVANALSHGHHITLVGYTPGNLAAAKLVAKDLLPTPTRIGPVDPRTAAVADALGATPPNVIVTLGSDFPPQ
jgi:hypothetical protein